jgi:hypothetical protein
MTLQGGIIDVLKFQTFRGLLMTASVYGIIIMDERTLCTSTKYTDRVKLIQTFTHLLRSFKSKALEFQFSRHARCPMSQAWKSLTVSLLYEATTAGRAVTQQTLAMAERHSDNSRACSTRSFMYLDQLKT